MKNLPIAIWAGHRILPNDAKSSVKIDILKREIEYLLNSGYQFIDVSELKKIADNGNTENKKYTMFTFDDGWADNHLYGTELLKELGVKAVIAVSTGLIDKSSFAVRTKKEYSVIDAKIALSEAIYNSNKKSFLTKGELIEMQKSGVWDIQAHGESHLGCYSNVKEIKGFYPKAEHWSMKYALSGDLFEGAPKTKLTSILSAPKTKLDEIFKEYLKNAVSDREREKICKSFVNPILKTEDLKQFSERVADELKECKQWFLNEIKKNVTAMFWPWGQYSADSIKAADNAKFMMCFSTEKRAFTYGTSIMEIPRVSLPDDFIKFKNYERIFNSQIRSRLRRIFTH